MNLRNWIAPAVLTLLIATVGCGASNAMVGTWKLEVDESMKKMVPADFKPPTMEFKGDNTFTANIEVAGKTSSASGTYKLDGKNLSVTMEVEDGKPTTNKKTETVTLSDDMKSFDMPGAAGMGKMVKQ